MRIALISDIHGNLVSFNAVLADITRQNLNEIIFLGDIATLGPQPHESVRRLQSIGCPCIIGNHETYLFKPSLGHAYMGGTRWFTDTLSWCRGQLTPEDYKFLRSFKPMIKVKLGPDTHMLCFHGSPRSNTDNLFAITPAEKVKKLLAGRQEKILVGGHTHVQMLRQFNGQLIVNAGSVGMPFEQMPFTGSNPIIMPWAEYAIVSYKNGVISVDLRRIPIDLNVVKEAAIQSRMPEVNDWLRNWQILNQLAE